MKMTCWDADRHINDVLKRFDATLEKARRIAVDTAEYTYILPSGTKLVLRTKLCFDSEHREINWRWILAD